MHIHGGGVCHFPQTVLTVMAAVLEAALTAPFVEKTAAAGAVVPVEVHSPSSCAAESVHLPSSDVEDPHLPMIKDAGATVN